MKKVAIITGATGGIGKAIAQRLRKEYRLALVYRSENKLQRLEEFKDDDDVLFVQGDLKKEEDCTRVIQQVVDAFGTIHVLVNNAGKTKDGLLMRMKAEDFQDVIETNLYSVFYMSKAALRPMLKNKEGKIINIASVVGITGNAGQTNYAASKAGIIAFTKSLAKEIAKKNIQVNAVCPGFIQSEMTENLEDHYIDRIPAARLGQPSDVAHMVYFLSSDASNYVNGKEFIVDGGLL